MRKPIYGFGIEHPQGIRPHESWWYFNLGWRRVALMFNKQWACWVVGK